MPLTPPGTAATRPPKILLCESPAELAEQLRKSPRAQQSSSLQITTHKSGEIDIHFGEDPQDIVRLVSLETLSRDSPKRGLNAVIDKARQAVQESPSEAPWYRRFQSRR